jgi:hypothetical protein
MMLAPVVISTAANFGPAIITSANLLLCQTRRRRRYEYNPNLPRPIWRAIVGAYAT